MMSRRPSTVRAILALSFFLSSGSLFAENKPPAKTDSLKTIPSFYRTKLLAGLSLSQERAHFSQPDPLIMLTFDTRWPSRRKNHLHTYLNFTFDRIPNKVAVSDTADLKQALAVLTDSNELKKNLLLAPKTFTISGGFYYSREVAEMNHHALTLGLKTTFGLNAAAQNITVAGVADSLLSSTDKTNFFFSCGFLVSELEKNKNCDNDNHEVVRFVSLEFGRWGNYFSELSNQRFRCVLDGYFKIHQKTYVGCTANFSLKGDKRSKVLERDHYFRIWLGRSIDFSDFKAIAGLVD